MKCTGTADSLEIILETHTHKHTYSQKMPLTALILNIVMVVYKTHKVQSSIPKGLKSLPAKWRLNATSPTLT